MERIAIVGGGLAGLTAAFRLRDRAEVCVLEANARLGGQIETTLERGFVIERGAEGFVARSSAVPALARDLGMEERELVAQAVLRSYGFDGAQLQRLEPGEAARFLGFQVSREDLGKGIRSLRRGMGSLIAALEGELRERVALHKMTRASALELGANELLVHASDGRSFAADRVVVATSAAAASRLLEPIVGEAAAVLAHARVLSSITVELAFESSAVEHALDASGFVVAEAAQREGLRACTFTSSKFDDRALPGQVSLRAFFRPSAGDFALDDRAYVARALAGIRRAFGVRGEPLASWVSRWPDALPVFDDAHRAAVAALERALAAYPIVLAGSAFFGSGIDAAVRSGERAASICGSYAGGSGCS